MSLWPPGMAIRPIQNWPGDFTRNRQRSRFDAAWSDTLELLRRELRMLGARQIVLQVAMTEQDFRIDGYPRAQAKAEHPGVILSLESRHGALSWPCDTFTTWQDNVRAIALAMEALRKVDRYGVTKRGEQYTGWKALPPGSGAPASHMTRDEALALVKDLTPPSKRDEPVERLVRWAKIGAHPDRHDGDHALAYKVDEAAKVLA